MQNSRKITIELPSEICAGLCEAEAIKNILYHLSEHPLWIAIAAKGGIFRAGPKTQIKKYFLTNRKSVCRKVPTHADFFICFS